MTLRAQLVSRRTHRRHNLSAFVPLCKQKTMSQELFSGPDSGCGCVGGGLSLGS